MVTTTAVTLHPEAMTTTAAATAAAEWTRIDV